MSNMINTSECINCIHGVLDDENRARVKVYCNVKDKTYWYGQCIPCEYIEKKKGSKEDEESCEV